MEIRDPLENQYWNKILLSNEEGSFFHSSNWARVLNESYGYTPLYLTGTAKGKFSLLIPLMRVKSILTGTRGVSLPFSDYCEPILPGNDDIQGSLRYLIGHGKKEGWRSIEIRSGKYFPDDLSPSSSYYGHTLNLIESEERIHSNFRDSTKRNIKKALERGVKAGIFTSLESLNEFYSLNCMTRRAHGLPPQPYYFFRKIYEHVISKDMGFVVLASYKGTNIAGAIFFYFGNKALFKYGASLMSYQHVRANNLVMWETISWLSRNGFKSLCFGRTELENVGLRQYKTGWGVEERIIKYYKYDLVEDRFVKDSLRVSGLHNKIFKLMPIPLSKKVGSLLYRHMG